MSAVAIHCDILHEAPNLQLSTALRVLNPHLLKAIAGRLQGKVKTQAQEIVRLGVYHKQVVIKLDEEIKERTDEIQVGKVSAAAD